MKFTTKYEGPHNTVERLLTLPVGEWRHQRPVTIIEKCCHCGLCYMICPTGCIEDKGGFFSRNLASCKGCGTCAAECPVDAIRMVEEEIAGNG